MVCGSVFLQERDYSREPDGAISASGAISLRKLFVEINGISIGERFSFSFTQSGICMQPDPKGIEIVRGPAGGFHVARNKNITELFRDKLGGIKKGQSAFFKFKKEGNAFVLFKIEYNSDSPKYKNRTANFQIQTLKVSRTL